MSIENAVDTVLKADEEDWSEFDPLLQDVAWRIQRIAEEVSEE